MIELTERLLSDAGGWQAMKEARTIHEAGRVLEATWEDPLLQGRVRVGETEYRTGLRIESRSRIDNLCTCREARQRGVICAHALAVGLAILKPRQATAPASSAASRSVSPTVPATPAAASKSAGPIFSEVGDPLNLAIVLPPNLSSAWEKDCVMVGVEVLAGGRRILLSALDLQRPYRASEIDQQLIRQFAAVNGGQLPGMLTLPRMMLSALLEALAGHPRVTLGKSIALNIGAQPAPRPDAIPSGAHLLEGANHPWLWQGNSLQAIEPEQQTTSGRRFNDRELLSSHGPAPRFFLKIEGSLNHLAAELEAHTETRRTTLGASSRVSHPAEAAAVERLLTAGFAPPNRDGQFILKGETRILGFFATELPRLEKIWSVTIGERFTHVTRDVERVTPRFEVRGSGENWFDLGVELGTASGERFSAAELQRLLQSGQQSIRTKKGKVAVFDTAMLDDFQEVLRDCNPTQKQPGVYRLDQRQAAYLTGFSEETGATFHGLSGSTQSISGPPRAISLGDLEDVLRPYQKHGVFWLNQLIINGYACLLADDMGLGKTLQAIALLRHIRGKSLVVCPSSLVFNWQREIQRFAPDLTVVTLTGADRKEARSVVGDVYLTSYAILRRDAAFFRQMEFTVAVLDEAQHIKNPDSQNAQAAFALRARHRVAMTGTPIENSIRDIWSLMQFLMPGYLGSRDDFRERFERAIDREPSGPAARRLRQRLRPFILRRLKKDVISELPDKLEQVAYCELTGDQKKLYDSVAGATRRDLASLAGSKDQARSRMMMLTALLRLRQICCDPRLLNQEDHSKAAEMSGKVELLMELLNEAVEGGHRVLVFSQFASMLRLLMGELQAADLGYCHLDGQTRDRATVVDRFQSGEVPVFLISLKAGGVGLNLTAADIVIHFDPWWNPAVEAQATDRAHRIGQKNVVTSYKLIARGTVEEKILNLQQRKRDLVAASLEGEEPLMEGLGFDELRELLE